MTGVSAYSSQERFMRSRTRLPRTSDNSPLRGPFTLQGMNSPQAPRSSPVPEPSETPYRLPVLSPSQHTPRIHVADFPPQLLGVMQLSQRMSRRYTHMVAPKFQQAMIAPVPRPASKYPFNPSLGPDNSMQATERQPQAPDSQVLGSPVHRGQVITGPAHPRHPTTAPTGQHGSLSSRSQQHPELQSHPQLHHGYHSVSVYRRRQPRSHGPYSQHLTRSCNPPQTWLLKTYGRSKTFF